MAQSTPQTLCITLLLVYRGTFVLEDECLTCLKTSNSQPSKASLDGEMKRLQAKGLGINRRQAEVITPEEETLWRTGQLGDLNPQQLLDTVIYCCGLFLALRSGREHQQLQRSPPQIQLIEQAGESAYLKYQEDISKNHPGGLEGSQDHTKSRLPSRKPCESRALLRATLQKVLQPHSPGCTS